MSPDIEWHIGEDAEQETIARTSSPRQSPRGRWAVIITIGLGVGLALLYRSIPDPPPRPIDPAPAPAVFQSPPPLRTPPRPLSPLPTPESLDAAIERDAEYLASMKTKTGVTFKPALARMPQAYADWYAAVQNAYGGWGPPSYQTLYTVFETGTLPGSIMWVKLGQFRHGDFYRRHSVFRKGRAALCGYYLKSLRPPSKTHYQVNGRNE
jgi:hypothetical protein